MTTISFETEECPTCGIVFQVPESFSEARQEDGQVFYCPNGHEQEYVDADDKQIEKLEAQVRELQIEQRRLKCRLLGTNGILDKIKVWWKGGLAK